jgi:hypothetical protein
MATSNPASRALTPRRPPVWAWPLAILLGFPIGGLIANIVVGPVDSLASALVGGLLAGAVIGFAQWFVLRRFVSWLWIAATSVGMALGLTVGAALVDYGISRGELVVVGAATGLVVGGLQALVFARQQIPGALLWAAVNPPAWALGWLVTSYVITTNVEEQFTNFGASGVLVFALLTGLLLAAVFRRLEAETRTA